MKISECMTKNVELGSPSMSIKEIAQLMQKDDCGSIPIAQDDKLIGMVTDRDIVIRAVAKDVSLDTPVESIMSEKILYCFDDQTTEEVGEMMRREQVRRMPVVDRNKRLVGIVSMGDLSSGMAADETKETLKSVSAPSDASHPLH